ncbi:L,D-transpeptidase family protein [Ottowia sp. GY511]|nr:L,D-transpeptidase family protein [Ottowia sp. GY511]
MLGALAAQASAQPLWLDASGHPNVPAREVVKWLVQSDKDGLRPADYDAAALDKALTAAQAQLPSADEAARLDAQLTDAVGRYLQHLRFGRVDAQRELNAHYDSATAPSPDLAQLLRDAVARGAPDEALRAATPPWPQYRHLREALVAYQAMGEPAAWQQKLGAPPGGKLQPGQRWNNLPRLAERLALLGDLPAGAAAPASYDATLQAAVKAFQLRHGLEGDGVVGKTTIDALDVPPAARARQIALALERLRLTPMPSAARFITVNIPEFGLRAFSQATAATAEAQPPVVRQDFAMKVIVGKALDTRTPLFDEDMRWIEFSPYWNIPSSIARKETVPKLRANPGYLAAQGMEFVHGSGISTAVSPEALNAVLAGQWRIRQRPGPRNALGNVKFMLPNNQAIYLHDTNVPSLFGRTRRDFSHGCIRVEQPVSLAQWLLQDQPDWTESRIQQAMHKPRPVTANLQAPVPVLIVYRTAVALPEGKVGFVPDLYGLDARLERALAAPRAAQAVAPNATSKAQLAAPPLHFSAGAPNLIAAQ